MQQRHVPDRDVAADDRHETARCNVHHRAVLQVGVLADPDVGPIAAQDDAEPDARVVGDLDIADQRGVGRDEGELAVARGDVSVDRPLAQKMAIKRRAVRAGA